VICFVFILSQRGSFTHVYACIICLAFFLLPPSLPPLPPIITAHIHTQAILTALIPLALLVPYSEKDSILHFRLSSCGILGLFPLFSHVRELPTKVLICIGFLRLVYILSLKKHTSTTSSNNNNNNSNSSKMTWIDYMLMISLTGTFLLCEVLFPSLFAMKNRSVEVDGSSPSSYPSSSTVSKFEFLPLMIMSVVCGVWVCFCWLTMTIDLHKQHR
jgi:hypothetical protein